MFFIMYQMSIFGHIPLSLMRLYSGSSIWMDDHCWLFTSWLRHQILYWGILSFPYRDFVCIVVWWWMIDVGYLPCDFNIKSYIRAYFPISFEYPWDWNSGQFGFRLSTSMGLLTIDYIRTSLPGFFEIEMDRIKFHPRSMGGSFSQMLIR